MTTPLTGTTALIFMLCDPVAHVKGTDLLNQRFDAEGIDAAYAPLHVTPEDLGQMITAVRTMRNVAGLGITIPHKIDVVPHLDELTDQAKHVGAVTEVRREADGKLVGANFDGVGFVAGLASRGISLEGRSVLQLGTGGAGRAIAFAIAEAGAQSLTLWNRTTARAEALAAEVAEVYPDCKVTFTDQLDPAGFEVLVNTTSVGMHGSVDMILDASRISEGTAICDIVVNPPRTPLLQAAEERGLPWSNGADMLNAQYELIRDFMGLGK